MGEHRFHTPDPVELQVQIPAGDIHVETIDGDESFVSVTGNEKLVEQTRVELEGGRLIVEFKGKKPFGIMISIGDLSFGNGGGLEVKAKVPHASHARLTTAAADMKLRGRYDALETKSASGDLRLEGEVEHNAAVKTVSGDVRVDRVGGELHIHSVSGDVNVASVGGSIESRSVSGDVRFDSVREGTVTVQSVSGDIEVGVAPGTNLDVDAGSVSGDLSSEVPLGSEPGGERGDGPTLVVRGKTVSGDFKVFRAA
jgi:hypothetical protein